MGIMDEIKEMQGLGNSSNEQNGDNQISLEEGESSAPETVSELPEPTPVVEVPAETGTGEPAETKGIEAVAPTGSDTKSVEGIAEIAPVAPQPNQEDEQAVEGLDELLNELNQLAQASVTPPPQSPQMPEQPTQQQQAPQAPIPFIQTQEQMEEIFSSPDGINKLLTNAVQIAIQTVYRSLPPIINNNTAVHLAVNKCVENFYKTNSDLEKIRPYVHKQATKIEGEHPDWTYDKIFDEAGKEVRKQLKALMPRLGGRLPSGSASAQIQANNVAPQARAKTPAFARASAARIPSDKTAGNEIMDELKNMMKL